MSADTKHSRFEVIDHFAVTSRGGLVLGNIVDGCIRVGMRVKTGFEPPELTVSGVEFVDNVSDGKHWNALVFAECPTLEFVERAFPVGSTLEVVAGKDNPS